MADLPLDKYSRIEIERRWLVDPASMPSLDGLPFREIGDLYIDGTRLRLRKISTLDGDAVYKLCKKYGMTQVGEPITNVYLSEDEYQCLNSLSGNRTMKKRYLIEGGSLDVYPHELAIFEIEFASPDDAAGYSPPLFAGREVTRDASLSGASIAGLHL